MKTMTARPVKGSHRSVPDNVSELTMTRLHNNLFRELLMTGWCVARKENTMLKEQGTKSRLSLYSKVAAAITKIQEKSLRYPAQSFRRFLTHVAIRGLFTFYDLRDIKRW